MTATDTIRIRQLGRGIDYPIPARETAGASSFDLRAAIEESFCLRPGHRATIPTGIALEMPVGFEAQIRPRSGLASRYGITVLNAPGTIDSDYRGEISAVIINLGTRPHWIAPGDRIAQLVIAQVWTGELVKADTLTGTDRGDGGFGSTGV